eukprot:5211100-Ditylum_brightwellii.AAC.1
MASPYVGTKLPRLHDIQHFLRQIKRDGAPNVTNIAYLEKAWKKFMKQPAKKTQRACMKLDSDLINR